MKKRTTIRKMVLCAIFASLAFVLNTFVAFPAMAPFQHFVNVMAAVFVGPWWGGLSGFLCGVMRMMCGRDIQAVAGAVFGPILGGLLWKNAKNVYLVWVGEIIGTGIIGALASYQLMKWIYCLEAQSPLYYIPFYIPSAVVGGMMGVMVLMILKRGKVLDRFLTELEG